MEKDYSKTVMYYIYFENTLLYIGHSTNFEQRKNSHKSSCYNQQNINTKYDLKIYKHIRDNNINWDQLEWIFENYPCINVIQAREREGELQKLYNPLCNVNIAGRTPKSWLEDKNLLDAYECVCGSWITNLCKFSHEKSVKHKNHILGLKKKEVDDQKNSMEAYKCPCGAWVTHKNKANHEQTIKHKNYT
jgi:hypothetical protein